MPSSILTANNVGSTGHLTFNLPIQSSIVEQTTSATGLTEARLLTATNTSSTGNTVTVGGTV